MATTPSAPYDLTAAEMARAVMSGKLTPSALADACLSRIAATESKVHAWCYLDHEGVRAQAEILTVEAAAGKWRGPLHGVPVGIKDEYHVKGMPTGLRRPSSGVERVDATPVARLRAAGAIVMGKTHMPIRGAITPTRNPWNLEHTPGGSSTGSGAAVAARMVPVALAEQTGGSALRPAAFCGVSGFVGTFGRVSRYGLYPLTWSIDQPGIIGLTVEDIALVYSVIAGPDPLDPTTLMDPVPPIELNPHDHKPPRIGIVNNFFPQRTEALMQEAIENAGARLRAAGARIVRFSLPDEFGLAWHIRELVGGPEGATLHADLPKEILGDSDLRDLGAKLIPATYYIHAQRIRRWLYQKVQAFSKDIDVLLMAVAPGAAPAGVQDMGDGILLRPWSCLGYPALTLNGGLSPAGLPLGLQFVGCPKKESELLRVGHWCELLLGRLSAPKLS